MWIAVLGLTLILACMFPIGLYAHLVLENVTDTDLIVPRLVNDPSIFPFWVTDLLIVSIVSAAMSSMDSVLLVASSPSTKTSLRHLKPLKTRFAGPVPQSLLSPAFPPSWHSIHRATLWASPSSRVACTPFASSHRWFLASMAVWRLQRHAGVNDSGDEYAGTLDHLGSKRPAPRGLPALLVSASVYWLQSCKETAAEV